MAAILKFFKQHLLPNHKSDWVKTWLEASKRHRDSELLKLSAFLKIFKQLLRLSCKSSIIICSRTVGLRGNLMEGIGAAWRFRIAKMILFWNPRWPPWQPSWKSWNHICYRRISLSLNMMGGIEVIWKFRIAKILLFQCSRWPPSWNSSNHISSQTVSQVEPKLDGRLRGEMEIKNCWIIQFQYPRWRPWWQSWNCSNNIRFWIAKGNLIW